MRQSKPTALIFVVVIIIALFFLLMSKEKPPSNLKCSGYYNSSYGNKSLSSQMRITFSGNNGAIILNGVVKDNKGNVADLTLSLLFSIKIINQSYVLTSKAINTQHVKHDKSMENPGYEDLLPEVFSRKDEMVIYTLYPQANNRYLFTRGRIPVFYCEKID